MKYIIQYKLFESQEVIPPLVLLSFHDIFQELKDDGFNVSIRKNRIRRLDFSKSNVVNIDAYGVAFPKFLGSEILDIIEVKINKKLSRFCVKDIIEVLKFADPYIKDVLKYTIENIYTMSIPEYMYYKSLDDLPEDKNVESLSIYFKKEDLT